MFKMQTKSAAGRKKKTAKNRSSISHLDSGGVIQRVKYQYHMGRWNVIGDPDQEPEGVPDEIPTEEYGIYDTATREYISPRAAHMRAFDTIFTARQHQQQRNDIARDIGHPLPPRNQSEMYSTTPMEDGSIDVKTPYYESSTMRVGIYREKGGRRKQPLVKTPGVPPSYGKQAEIMDRMPPEKRRRVFSEAVNWASRTDYVDAPKDLIESMSMQERKVASQILVSVGAAESHDTRANPDGGKVSRASFRMMQQYSVREVLHPQSGANIMARKGGNQTMREIFSDEVPHTPTRQTSLAPMYPFLSPKSPAPQRPAALDEERDTALTEEERRLWHPAAIRIEEYMVYHATPWEKQYFEHQIGLETIRSWIADPRQMTREGLGKMKQFL